MSEPREFWINKVTMIAEIPKENILVHDPRRQIIHVIDKQAYSKAIAERDELRAEKTQMLHDLKAAWAASEILQMIAKERDEYKAKVEDLECICPACGTKAEKQFELYDGHKVYTLHCEGCGMSWLPSIQEQIIDYRNLKKIREECEEYKAKAVRLTTEFNRALAWIKLNHHMPTYSELIIDCVETLEKYGVKE